jgi:glycerol-3-phosphate acyltransferase PlsY
VEAAPSVVSIVAATCGYLAGSISWTRVLGRWATPDDDLASTTYAVGGGEAVAFERVSSTSLTVRGRGWWGFAAMLGDLLKAAIPVALARRSGGDVAALAAGVGAVVGHVWPVFHRFRGGFGVTTTLGVLLVLDPVALVGAIAVTLLLGVVLADRWVAYDGWLPALVVWYDARGAVADAIAMAALTAIAAWVSREEWRRHIVDRRTRKRPWRERLGDITMGYVGRR